MYVYLCVYVSVSVCSKKKFQKNPISTNYIYVYNYTYTVYTCVLMYFLKLYLYMYIKKKLFYICIQIMSIYVYLYTYTYTVYTGVLMYFLCLSVFLMCVYMCEWVSLFIARNKPTDADQHNTWSTCRRNFYRGKKNSLYPRKKKNLYPRKKYNTYGRQTKETYIWENEAHIRVKETIFLWTHCNTLRHAAACFNVLQHTQCSTLQHTAAHWRVKETRFLLKRLIFIFVGKRERWGAGVETQKNVREEIGGWGRVPFNEPCAPLLSTIYDGA